MSDALRDSAFRSISKLSERYLQYESQFRSTGYLESQIRLDFLDAFWIAMGWDVRHENQVNPYRQEVRVEKSQDTGEKGRKRPDYTFYMDPEFRDPRFIVEAKRPGVALTDTDPLLQAIRYGWNAGLSVVVLHNFAEFVVVDTRGRPDVRSAHAKVLLHLTVRELQEQENFDKIYFLFARPSAADGALQRYAQSLPTPRRAQAQMGLFQGGYRAIDIDFLETLERWRDQLARGLKNKNHWMDSAALTECTQRILDRLVLLRFLEDKQIETRITIGSINQKNQVWSNFQKASRQLDSIYNGIVFKYHPLIDSTKLYVDESVFGDICDALDPLVSDYDFAQIPIQILGSIYERFLGKVIVATDKRARVEERPEVRKAGGIYYTPTHIVHHIVDGTLGPLFKGKSFESLKKLKICDTACGSGSFLIAAFDALIQAAAEWFNDNPQKAKDAGCIPVDGGWRLSLAQKRELLVSCIYGVDLDHQAIEVAQLSLSLKLLEDETAGSAFFGQQEIEQALLPSLMYNVIWGNALIDVDFYDGEMFPDADLKLKPTSLMRSFASVFKQGGFDAIVGNPPYLFITELSQEEKDYFSRRYETVEYRFDIYGLFMERAAKELLTQGGRLGYIIPHTLLANDSYIKLRKLLLERTTLVEVTDIGAGVFQGAKNETMVVLFENSPAKRKRVDVCLTTAKTFPTPTKAFSINQSEWLANPKHAWLVHVDTDAAALISKMGTDCTLLGTYCTVNQGLRTGDNEKFIKPSSQGPLWVPVAGGKDVARYTPLRQRQFVLYDPAKLDAPRRREIFDRTEKIVVQEIRNISLARRIVATLDTTRMFCLQSTNVIGLREDASIDLYFLLGVIGSHVMNHYFRLKFPANNHIASNQLAALPIPRATPADHLKVRKLVEALMKTVDALHITEAPLQQESLRARAQALDTQIERLVCGLYGVPPDVVPEAYQ